MSVSSKKSYNFERTKSVTMSAINCSINSAVEALIFFRLLLSSCLNWKIHCEDHSSLSRCKIVTLFVNASRLGEKLKKVPFKKKRLAFCMFVPLKKNYLLQFVTRIKCLTENVLLF